MGRLRIIVFGGVMVTYAIGLWLNYLSGWEIPWSLHMIAMAVVGALGGVFVATRNGGNGR